VKISTASTRRAIDKWKRRAKAEVAKSRFWGVEMVARFVTPGRWGRMVMIPPLVLALSFNFAVLELAILVLLCYFTVKLQCYRLFNSMLGVFVPSF